MKFTTPILVALVFCPVVYGAEPQPLGDYRNDPAREQAFMDWGLGMFVHWSVDVELGSVISHSLVGASEDYIERYVRELPRTFNPTDYDPDAWVKLAKLAGCKYMVLTTKHHNGFCLWPTKTTEFSVANTPYKKDIVKAYVEACRRHEMKVGFYFSPEDFLFIHKQGHEIRRKADYANISSNKDLLAHNQAQIRELFGGAYGDIDVAFLDAFDNAVIRDLIHQLQPKCLVTRGEMKTPEQQIPNGPIPGPWEACFTLGTQWQFKPTNENYKSGGRLIEMLVDVRAKGGNLLINMGPDPSGKIPFEQERAFRELALWMFVNGEAIHGVRPGPVVKEGDLWFTRDPDRDGRVYLIIPQGDERWKRGDRREFRVGSLRARADATISVLGQSGKTVEYSPKAKPEARLQAVDGGILISVVRAQRLYNNHQWPNPLVACLDGVEFSSPGEGTGSGGE
ncbi:alpha-L-fucosidase [Haloferula sp. A504]|uniref:alpha-L-fucosidase n=1 Tax=Haloferula sp. A504 TaxID=3373601 RepID=UPI0031C49541|nr:alpha-L-fucosidase [Verrucomicrobiaceae bacterium E54]